MGKEMGLTAEELNNRHAEKMQKKKLAREKIEAGKTDEKGLLIVHTGKGKGKSTAAFGMIFRALGHGMNVGVIQFGKGSRDTGERLALANFPNQVSLYARGQGFTWETQDRNKDIELAEEAWAFAKPLIFDEHTALVLLDEVNIMLRYGYLDIQDVLETLAQRPPHKHVIATGRNAPADMIDMADLVTEMTLVKHPFRNGIKGQRGIEY